MLQRIILLLLLCEFLWFWGHLSSSIFVWLFTSSSSFAIVGSLHIKELLVVVVFGHAMLLLVSFVYCVVASGASLHIISCHSTSLVAPLCCGFIFMVLIL